MRVVWTLSMILAVSACAASAAPAAGDEAPLALTPKPVAAAADQRRAGIFGVRPGHPLLFTIAATGRRPMQFAAEGCPRA